MKNLNTVLTKIIFIWCAVTGEESAEIVNIMRGDYPTIPDIVLDALVLPANLLSNESLSPEEQPEEEQLFTVDTLCYICKVRLRVCVSASEQAIRSLQVLLFRELQFLCPTCARSHGHHGGSR